MNQSKFVKYHVPCPECKSTDACSINEDGSAKCFSCDAFFPKYSNGTVMSTENYNKPTPPPKVLNAHDLYKMDTGAVLIDLPHHKQP